MTMIRVKATRTFNGHTAGDVLLVEQTAEIEQLVKARLFEIIAVETTTPPETPPETTPETPPAKVKPKAKAKPKANGKPNV